jgi:hypothetical protein
MTLIWDVVGTVGNGPINIVNFHAHLFLGALSITLRLGYGNSSLTHNNVVVVANILERFCVRRRRLDHHINYYVYQETPYNAKEIN